MKLLDDILKLKDTIQESGEYVGSMATRAAISNFYKNQWLPLSQDFKNQHGTSDFQIVDENAFAMYELTKTQKPSKAKLLANIKAIISILDKIELNAIRGHGSNFEYSNKTISLEKTSTENNPEKAKTTETTNKRAVFVIHGRNLAIRDSMFDFLRSIDLRPLEWSELIKSTGIGAPYIGDVLDKAFSEAQAIVVLMTPDDEGRLREQFRGEKEPLHETEFTPQARLNVIFEAGMAIGRCPNRTIIAEVGSVRPFSDIIGRHSVRLDDSAEKRHDLAQRLETAGCHINIKGVSWLKVGNFSAKI